VKVIDVHKKLADYESLQFDEVLYQTIIAAPALDCQIIGSVQINGRDAPFSFNAADQLVRDKATNKLADVQAKMAAIEAAFGITK